MPKYKVALLNGAFMLASILGFFISIFFISSISLKWAWAIGFLCVVMFAAALISVTYGPAPDKTFLEKKMGPSFKVATPSKAISRKPAAKKKAAPKATKKKTVKRKKITKKK